MNGPLSLLLTNHTGTQVCLAFLRIVIENKKKRGAFFWPFGVFSEVRIALLTPLPPQRYYFVSQLSCVSCGIRENTGKGTRLATILLTEGAASAGVLPPAFQRVSEPGAPRYRSVGPHHGPGRSLVAAKPCGERHCVRVPAGLHGGVAVSGIRTLKLNTNKTSLVKARSAYEIRIGARIPVTPELRRNFHQLGWLSFPVAESRIS